MLNQARLLQLDEGQTVINEGDRSRSVFLVLRGSVAVVVEIGGRDMAIAKLGPGDIFGEMAFITGNPRTATVVSESSDLIVLELDFDLLERMIEIEPSVLKYLYDIYRSRRSN